MKINLPGGRTIALPLPLLVCKLQGMSWNLLFALNMSSRSYIMHDLLNFLTNKHKIKHKHDKTERLFAR